MRRLLAVLVVIAVGTGALTLIGAGPDAPQGRTYKIVFDNAFGLSQGGDLRMGGVRIGETTGFSVTKAPGHSPKAVVTGQVTRSGVPAFRSDASCEIRPQSLIGEYYVDCQPGSSRRVLPNDGRVPVTQTSSTVPLDVVQDIMRRPYRDRLRLLITELGTGLAGRIGDLQQVVRRADPGLRETSRVLRILGDQNRDIERFIRDADTVVAPLARKRRDVSRFIREAGITAEITASRREDLRLSVARLPAFLGELRPYMVRLGALSRQQLPVLADLGRAAPSLNTLFARLPGFAREARPALLSLGDTSKVGTRAVHEGQDDVSVLRQLAANAPATAKSLRQFLQTLDDRKRATDSDARATVGGPPAPDKTHIPKGGKGGFTGMESIWNYFYWQSLTINGYDSVSHILRVLVDLSAAPCGFTNQRPASGTLRTTFDSCQQWLGPYQPGITAPDPTARSAQAALLRAASDRPAARANERRGPGQPEAGPKRGQPDVSKPQIVLPPGSAPASIPAGRPAAARAGSGYLLDYLLRG